MEQLKIIRTVDQMKELERYLEDKDYVAYDTETTGVTRESHIIGFSVCAELDVGYYVILSYWDVPSQQLVWLETKEYAPRLLEKLKGKKLIMQNAPFDCAMTVNNYGVELMPYVEHDTMIGGHLLNENRLNGLKERAVELYGESSAAEQAAMKESVLKNGGVLTKKQYELYKADADLIAHYGAKDAILTLKIFFNDVPELFKENLDKFFYEEESMPLLRGPTYELNTTGLQVDPVKLTKLRAELEVELLEAKAFIYQEIDSYVKEKYPATGKTNVFNIGAPQQRSWLLFVRLGNLFCRLTKTGREMCKELGIRVPYSNAAKREFIEVVTANKGRIWKEAKFNKKTGKFGRPAKVGDPWQYMQSGKETLGTFAAKYKWVAKYLEYAKNSKLLNTYVLGIQGRMSYNVIRPEFWQHGTTSGRYSSRNPNFQNLPRDDKRVKACIVARQGMAFVGADYAQLEPRTFASISQDEALTACFEKGEDFYSVVGAPIFDKTHCSLVKNDKNSFAKLHPELRDKSKVIALATPYGRTAAQQAGAMGIEIDASQELINKYFDAYPRVEIMMLESHEQAKKNGVVHSLFGRPRRIPEAMDIPKIYGNASHGELPYDARNWLNLSMNHRIQSTAASIVNRAAIAIHRCIIELEVEDAAWGQVKLVLQVHDELVYECPERLSEALCEIMKFNMENAATLPGVKLLADPKKAYNLADLK